MLREIIKDKNNKEEQGYTQRKDNKIITIIKIMNSSIFQLINYIKKGLLMKNLLLWLSPNDTTPSQSDPHNFVPKKLLPNQKLSPEEAIELCKKNLVQTLEQKQLRKCGAQINPCCIYNTSIYNSNRLDRLRAHYFLNNFDVDCEKTCQVYILYC